MNEAYITVPCKFCLGTGIIVESRDEDGNPASIPCTYCDSTHRSVSPHAIDITTIMEELTDIKDRVNDIKEKVDEIKTVVDGL